MNICKKLAFLLAAFSLTTSVALASPEAPTDQEVRAAYDKASVVYNWFDQNTLPTDGRLKKEVGFMIYYNVEYPGIKTMANLRQQMDEVFTPELTGMLFSGSRAYKEFSGQLYVAPASRGDNAFAGKSTFSIFRVSP